jgi:hypothetical protein
MTIKRPQRQLRQRAQGALHGAETFFNQVADSERQWWPFEFMRPEVQTRFSTQRAAALAVLQGVPIGLFLLLIDATSRHAATQQRLFMFLLTVCATVFATNRPLAYFWNRRADRIARLREPSGNRETRG